MKYSLLALLLAFGLTAIAQQDDFASDMKATKAAMDVISKAEKKSGPQVTGAAERIASVYEEMIPFWRGRNALGAVKISQEGKAAATTLASAAFGNDEAKAADALKTLGGTCKSCHDTYRERTPEGKFKIK